MNNVPPDKHHDAKVIAANTPVVQPTYDPEQVAFYLFSRF
jgi:hypothetical protein